MKNKNKKKSKKIICFKISGYILLSLFLIFLALPLIFQEDYVITSEETKNSTALPFKTENPFTEYLRLFKNFYNPDKITKKGTKSFSKTDNSLIAKNTSTEVSNKVVYEEEPPVLNQTRNSLENPYVANAKSYYTYSFDEEEEILDLIQDAENQAPFVEQKTFEDFAMEGLYDTSHTDPYEVKKAAKENLLGIISPIRRPVLTPKQNTERMLASNIFSNETKNTDFSYDILEVRNTNSKPRSFTPREYKAQRAGANNSFYDYGSLNSFNYSNPLMNRIDLDGLSFEDQVELVSGRIHAIHQANMQNATNNSGTNGNNGNTNNGNNNTPNGHNNGHNNHHPNRPPLPPGPPRDTFNPALWDTNVTESCEGAPENTMVETNEAPISLNWFGIGEEQPHAQPQEPIQLQKQDSSNTEVQSTEVQNTGNQENTNPDKIDTCTSESVDRLDRINSDMQKNHNYFIVSGRYRGQIMIPAMSSLPDRVLTTTMTSDANELLNMPAELSGNNLAQNTEKTEFEFVSALKPQIFDQIMKDDKTILLSVDEEDLRRYPNKTILIKSGEIETYTGANKIIKDINDFPAKLEELKKAQEIKEQQDKEQKTQDLKENIESLM